MTDKARVLKPSTLKLRALALDLFVTFLQERNKARRMGLDLLSREALSGFWQWLRAGRPDRTCSPATANSYVVMVDQAWRWLWDSDEYRDDCPQPRRIELPRAGTDLAPYAPTWSDVDAAVVNANGWYRHLMTLLRFTGLRVSQAMRLLWTDIDLEKALLTIRPELGKTRSESRGRVIPVSEHLIEELAGWGVREGWIIKTRGKVRDPSRQTMRDIWTRAGISRDKWMQPSHCFRRCVQTHFQRVGVPYVVAEYILGHDVGIGAMVYTAPWAYMEAMREAVATIPPIGGSNIASIGDRSPTKSVASGEGQPE